MSLSVSIATPHSVWTLTDRRLAAEGDTQSTDASKIVCVDSSDGVGLLSYAGLGRVAGTDPDDWVASVFRDMDTDFHGYMMALAEAANSAVSAKERRAEPGHLFVATAVVNGQPVLYSLSATAAGGLRLKRHERACAFMLAGAGGAALTNVKERLVDDAREILDWIKRADSEEAHPREVTNRLETWIGEARRERDEVSSRSIVAYRFVRDGEGAAGRCFYDDGKLEPPDAQLLHLSSGTDMNEMFELMRKEATGTTLSIKETSKIIAYKRRKQASESKG